MNLAILPLWFGATVLFFYLMKVGKSLLIPLVIAIVIWYLLNVLAAVYQRFTIKYWPLCSPAFCFSAAIFTFLLIIALLMSLISNNINDIMNMAPNYQQNFTLLISQAGQWLGLKEIPDFIVQLPQEINLSQVIAALVDALTTIASHAIFIFLYVLFLVIEQSHFRQKTAALIAISKRKTEWLEVIRRIHQDIQTYIWVKTSMSLLTAILSYFVMAIVGVDFAAFWAIIIFFLNYIPSIGSFIGTLLPSILTIVQFGSFYPPLIVLVLLGTIQFGIGNILEPRIMGRSLNLSITVILFSLMLWGQIWGVLGMFLCVPIMVIAVIIFSHFDSTRPIAIIMSADGQIEANT